MKKFLSLLVLLVLIFNCFVGCTGEEDSSTETEKETTKTENEKETYESIPENISELLGFDEKLGKIVDSLIAFKPDIKQAFIKGDTKPIINEAFKDGDKIFVPGKLIAETLGGEVERNGEKLWSIKMNDKEYFVDVEKGTVESDGKVISVKEPVVEVEDDFMMSTTDYSETIEVEMLSKDDLVLFGEDVTYIDTITKDGKENVLNYIDRNLNAEGYYEEQQKLDRRKISKIVDIDPLALPLSIPGGVLVAVSDCLYVEELEFAEHPTKDDYFVCKMVVYNTGYTYGVAESYTDNEERVSQELIEPYNGMYQSAESALANTALIIDGWAKWIEEGDMGAVEYRTSAVSKASKITLDVPKDGFVFLTNNPNYSETVAACNIALYTIKFYMSQTDLPAVIKIPDELSTFENLVVENSIKKIKDDPAAVSNLANIYNSYMETIKGATPFSGKTYLQDASKKVFDEMAANDYDIRGLINESLDLTAQFISKGDDIMLEKLLSKCPPIDKTLDFFDFYSDAVDLVCLSADFDTVEKTKPLAFVPCNWREAYAEVLRTVDFIGADGMAPKFGLCYIDKNSIPELVVMDCQTPRSRAYIFTYQEEEARKIAGDSLPSPYGYLHYYEFADFGSSSYLNRGYFSVTYSPFLFPNSGKTHKFEDDYNAVGKNSLAATFKYNGREVPKWYYDYMMGKLNAGFAKFEEKNLGYENCYNINEANIKAHILNNK